MQVYVNEFFGNRPTISSQLKSFKKLYPIYIDHILSSSLFYFPNITVLYTFPSISVTFTISGVCAIIEVKLTSRNNENMAGFFIIIKSTIKFQYSVLLSLKTLILRKTRILKFSHFFEFDCPLFLPENLPEKRKNREEWCKK